MRPLHLTLILILLAYPALAQVAERDALTIAAEGETFVLEADVIEGSFETGQWKAFGNVVFRRGIEVLTADEVAYDSTSRTGNLRGAAGKYGAFYFTGESAELSPDGVVTIRDGWASTCNLDRPHWAIGVRSIDIHPGQFAVARRIAVRIGSQTLFAFPSYRFSLRPRDRSFLPVPGYDQRDGAYLRFAYPFSTSLTSAAAATGRLTSKNGLLTTVEFQKDLWTRPEGISGEELREEVVSDFSSIRLLTKRRAGSTPPLGPLADRQQDATEPDLEQAIHLYTRVARKERVFDPDSRFLYLDRQPEAGIRLLEIPILGSAARSPLYTNAQFGYGRFRERHEGLWRERWDARADFRIRTNMGKRWLFEPALFARWSSYSSGDEQTLLATSFAIGRQVAPRYFAALTHVRHWTSGSSPFDFDNLDVEEKLATRIDADWGRTRASVTLDFDLERGGVYDWGLDLARAMHCFEPRLHYQWRYRDLSFNVVFIPVRL